MRRHRSSAIAGVRIFVPTRGQVCAETAQRLQTIRDATPGLAPVQFHVAPYSVEVARNAVVRRFLADEGATVLVMVDDDVRPHPNFLDGLAALNEFGVLGFATSIRAGTATADAVLADGTVDYVGTGCVAIRRDVLEALGPDPFHTESFITNFHAESGFSAGVDMDARAESGYSYQLPGEDMQFCRDARAAGFAVGIDRKLPADHRSWTWWNLQPDTLA